jgi:hypothetical protein
MSDNLSNVLGVIATIQCPYCNKLILLNKDSIIPKCGFCPNCGVELTFERELIKFPNSKLDVDGQAIDKKPNQTQDLYNALDKIQDLLLSDNLIK